MWRRRDAACLLPSPCVRVRWALTAPCALHPTPQELCRAELAALDAAIAAAGGPSAAPPLLERRGALAEAAAEVAAAAVEQPGANVAETLAVRLLTALSGARGGRVRAHCQVCMFSV
jgi:hypothetical protein